jgi:hypothetical protein
MLQHCSFIRSRSMTMLRSAPHGAHRRSDAPHLLSSVIVDKIECAPSAVVFRARCWAARAACLACGTWSSRVHSSYFQQVRDLPLADRPVLIRLAMRQFLRTNAGRENVTYAGQADGLTARYQRWSVPLAGLLSQIAPGAGGRDLCPRSSSFRLAAGLSASGVTRLTESWQEEYRRFAKRDLSGADYVYVWPMASTSGFAWMPSGTSPATRTLRSPCSADPDKCIVAGVWRTSNIRGGTCQCANPAAATSALSIQ